MSYVKLHKVVSDFAVGVQSVNQAIDNNQALFDQLDVGHSMGRRGSGQSDPFLQPGQHDDPLVARSAFQFVLDDTTATPTLQSFTAGAMLFDSPEFLDVGTWRIYVTTPQIFAAVATARAAATGDYYAQARVVNDASGPYIVVTTWNIAASAVANMSFDLAVWAEAVV